MNVRADKRRCCGCNACYQICPKKCITMKADEEGFFYPHIDDSICIKCGKCEEVCPFLQSVVQKETKHITYACQNREEKVRKISSSGGIFSLLAKAVFDLDGIVYGAAFQPDFSVKHIGIEKKADLEALLGSKYVQSEIGEIYYEVEEKLKEEKIVLFSGTPCQINGLKKYLRKEYKNLYTCDFICHGVPSPKVWKNYCDILKEKFQSPIEDISFRNKTSGWKDFRILVKFKDHACYNKSHKEDLYMKGFLSDLYLRPSCYQCVIKGDENRMADLTLGDFWGIRAIAKELDDDKGTSLICVHTDKGFDLTERIIGDMIYKEVERERALQENRSYYNSVKYNTNRDQFFMELKENNIIELIERYKKKEPSWYQKRIYQIKRVGKSIVLRARRR